MENEVDAAKYVEAEIAVIRRDENNRPTTATVFAKDPSMELTFYVGDKSVARELEVGQSIKIAVGMEDRRRKVFSWKV